MKKALLACALALAAAVASAVGVGNGTISVTSTSQTVAISASSSVSVKADSANAVTAYVKVYRCGETVPDTNAATTSSIPLAAGEELRLTHNSSTEPGRGYCAISAVSAGGTPSLTYVNK